MNFAKPEHSGGVASMPARRLKSGPNSPSHQIPTTAYSRSSKANASTNSVVFQSTDYSTGISAGATADGVRNNTASPVVVVTHKPIARVGEASRHVSPTELGPKANSSALYLQRNMRLESEPHARTTCAFERIQETEYSSAYDTSDDEQATYLEHMGAHFDDAVCTDRDSSPQTTDKNQRSQVEAPQRHMSQSKKKGIKFQKLQSVWSFWWHDRTAITSDSAYRKHLKKLGTFRTLQGFSSIFSFLKKPTQVQDGIHFHLFKGAKPPCWERYSGGGMFLLAFDIEFADEAWERACFAAIGSTITAPCFQGLACTRRGKRFLLQCWFKHALVEQLQDLRSQLLHYVHHQMTCPVRIVERVFP